MRHIPSFLTVVAFTGLVAMLACEQPTHVAPTEVELRTAKGGNGKGGGGNGEIEVRSVDPDTALQGQVLDVDVSGSGFDAESQVSFEMNGFPVNDVAVQATQFVSSRKLVANVAVASDAELTKYDVAVESVSRGKKGIGLELFEVKAEVIPLSVVVAAGFDAAEDGEGAYVDGSGEVLARIFATSNFGIDVRGSKKGRNKSDRRICVTIRSWPDGATTLFPQAGEDPCLDVGLTTNFPDNAGGFAALQDGQQMTTRMRFLWANESGKDVWIRYGSKCEWSQANGWTADSASRADVTGTVNGWTIEAEPAFWCLNNPTSVVPHPSAGDPEGRVLVGVRFEAERLEP